MHVNNVKNAEYVQLLESYNFFNFIKSIYPNKYIYMKLYIYAI